MHTRLPLTVVALLLCAITTHAQDHTQDHRSSDPSPADVFTLGIGFGQDYGGLGGSLTVYPQKNVGLFGGFGYALAGFGYNAGIKLRLLPGQGRSTCRPFVEAMYGYTTAVHVTNADQYDKLFYGPTVGGGVDIGSRDVKHGYLSLAILVPIRNSDPQNYIDELQNMGVDFKNNLLPITFSLGYKIVVD